jgi:hypothetical protein
MEAVELVVDPAAAAGFGIAVWIVYFVLCGALAVVAGVLVSRVLFEPECPQ